MLAKCPKCESSLGVGGWTIETLENGIHTDIEATAIICSSCLSVIGVLPK